MRFAREADEEKAVSDTWAVALRPEVFLGSFSPPRSRLKASYIKTRVGEGKGNAAFGMPKRESGAGADAVTEKKEPGWFQRGADPLPSQLLPCGYALISDQTLSLTSPPSILPSALLRLRMMMTTTMIFMMAFV